MERIGASLAVLTLLAANAAWAGPPYHTDDPEPLARGDFEANNGIGATWFKGDVVAFGPQFDMNYGAAPGLQIKVTAQDSFDKSRGEPAHYGFGDLDVGTKIRLVDEDHAGWIPMVGIYPTIAFPSGDANRNLGTGYAHFLAPIYVQKTFGDWTAYGGGGYWFNRGGLNRDYWDWGAVLQNKITEALSLGGEIFYTTSSFQGLNESLSFNLGGSYDFSEMHHILFSAGTGILKQETNRFSFYLAYQLSL